MVPRYRGNVQALPVLTGADSSGPARAGACCNHGQQAVHLGQGARLACDMALRDSSQNVRLQGPFRQLHEAACRRAHWAAGEPGALRLLWPEERQSELLSLLSFAFGAVAAARAQKRVGRAFSRAIGEGGPHGCLPAT
ncbi:hypothetical protein ABPG75_005123 [Micractinium tetrahymenae]